MTASLALLPMYDWPELREATDQYWVSLRESLADYGFPAPKFLTRPEDPLACWRHPDLLLAQTCGLPLVEKLAGEVAVVGTPAYNIDCGAGSYFSVIVVHQESRIQDIADIDGAVFGYNDPLSQSGVAAFFFHLSNRGISHTALRKFTRVFSHRNAIRQLAERQIDIASIDAVTWEIARRHEKATEKLRVIGMTDPTPGLPLITARQHLRDVDRLHQAVVEAMASLSQSTRDDLLLTGLAATNEQDYQIILNRFNAVRAAIASNLH
ncbi:PhnD/SsuA/transferrin family substrate-binding protein [Sneathiella chungangensis]|uniref:PhnD/SsuA/transferrin family substrate-binding protein n=1 Tax=Sneathiella chungangensis TaxID=1418234 RepID=A0A845MLL3_9PROT|nr:PhnD/SsuA/transferrin family substrate-binding protein [Sneathiella chungangensis]MZR23664.1 PhnD/SsuA/transferrin family substrate-binding protein [Sneathiella chungangensis]